MASKGKIIQGEASESDSEGEMVEAPSSTADGDIDGLKIPTIPVPQAMVVAGEAPEPGEGLDISAALREAGIDLQVQYEHSASDNVETSSVKKPSVIPNSLFAKKLAETAQAANDSKNALYQTLYRKARLNIKEISKELTKSVSEIQEASNNLRQLTNNLFFTEDKLDIIVQCSLIPSFDFKDGAVASSAAAAVSSS